MLVRLRQQWGADQKWPDLIEEIDLTLKHIQQNK